MAINKASILETVEDYIGVSESYDGLDSEVDGTESLVDPILLTNINMAFATLHQLGVGPSNGFTLSSRNTTWDEFMHSCSLRNMAKDYVCLKTKMGYDPPASSSMAEACKQQISELEWRMNVIAWTGV